MNEKWQHKTTQEADYHAACSSGYELWREADRQERNRRVRDARYELDFDWPSAYTDDDPYGEDDE